jgi:hypothetical protein
MRFSTRPRLAVPTVLFALALLVVELGRPESTWLSEWGFALAAPICIAGGVVVGRWWALAVPIAVEVARTVADGYPALPLADPYLLLAVAIGVGVRKAGGPLVSARGRVRLDRLQVAGLILYVAAALSFAVVALLPSSDGVFAAALVALGVVHLVSGLAIGRWPAVFLPVLLVVLTIPVPTDPDAYEPIPMWLAILLWFAPLGAVVLALGVGARRGLAAYDERSFGDGY